MLSISACNQKFCKIPTPDEELNLKKFLQFNKEAIYQKINEYFEGFGSKEEEVGDIERSYIIKQTFKKISSLPRPQPYILSPYLIISSSSYGSQWLSYGPAFVKKSGFSCCTYHSAQNVSSTWNSGMDSAILETWSIWNINGGT
ncbi:hypothetical protein O181_054672 [Austropuccinia psidii MF-1]|uniref:Uncharacterized protein n=1 Tax=Austropuccinia psidii MF-1 TaxID=1389203 RepID=A0A9Q3E7D1_9BASI|nr:hypothetical protein [Austropuccinia psidii MF-1]